MYKVVYVFFYLLSLLPWRIAYVVSDFMAFLLQYVVRYRKQVIEKNLIIAFPKKSVLERKKLQQNFIKTLQIHLLRPLN
jgi:KDO2-lipid IV(A) lauroyltransferase